MAAILTGRKRHALAMTTRHSGIIGTRYRAAGEKPAHHPIVNAAGLWTGSSRTTSAAGGECVGPTLAASVGATTPITVQVSQNGSVVTAVVTGTTTGVYTNYSGTAGSSSISLSWTYSSAGLSLGFGARTANCGISSSTTARSTPISAVTVRPELALPPGMSTCLAHRPALACSF